MKKINRVLRLDRETLRELAGCVPENPNPESGVPIASCLPTNGLTTTTGA